MRKTILTLAFAGSMLLAASACNSTKNVSGAVDTTGGAKVDSVPVRTSTVDTIKKDTSKTTSPDTTKRPKM